MDLTTLVAWHICWSMKTSSRFWTLQIKPKINFNSMNFSVIGWCIFKNNIYQGKPFICLKIRSVLQRSPSCGGWRGPLVSVHGQRRSSEALEICVSVMALLADALQPEALPVTSSHDFSIHTLDHPCWINTTHCSILHTNSMRAISYRHLHVSPSFLVSLQGAAGRSFILLTLSLQQC